MTDTADAPLPYDEKSVVKSLFKALSLLECFSPETPELSVAELAKRTGVQKATCNRLVTTMMHAGWLTRVGDSRYAPTVKLFRIGSTAIHRLDIREAARPWLERIAKRFGDTAFLFVPDGSRVVCLDRVTGSNPLQLHDLAAGMSLPFNVGAAPVAILAHRNDLLEQIDMAHLPEYTERTASDRAALEQVLATTREQGYAVSREDWSDGVAAVGAPVFDSRGVAVGGLSMGGVASGFVSPRIEEIIEAVRKSAAELSAHLGHDHGGATS
jgi:DNA-binding IclR family transcriptional regulator